MTRPIARSHPFVVGIFMLTLSGLSPAAEVEAGPIQTTEAVYPSVDGGEVHCYPNLTDSPRGKETRERLLTLGPEVDLATLMGPRDNANAAEMQQFQKQIGEQREKDWAYRCRYRQDNARLRAAGSSPEVVFIGDSLTENWPAALTRVREHAPEHSTQRNS